MTDRSPLFPNRLMRLQIDVQLFGVSAALIDKETRQIQIAFFICRLPELDQRQFNFFMAGRCETGRLFDHKNALDQVCKPADTVQQATFSGRMEIGNGRFHPVPGAV